MTRSIKGKGIRCEKCGFESAYVMVVGGRKEYVCRRCGHQW